MHHFSMCSYTSNRDLSLDFSGKVATTNSSTRFSAYVQPSSLLTYFLLYETAFYDTLNQTCLPSSVADIFSKREASDKMNSELLDAPTLCSYLTGVLMAEEHAEAVRGYMVDANDGINRDVLEKHKTSTMKSSEDSNGCASSSDPAPPRSEYFSTRIAALMESRTEFESALERDIEASKVHWSELQAGNGGEESSAEQNLEVFRSLQLQPAVQWT